MRLKERGMMWLQSLLFGGMGNSLDHAKLWEIYCQLQCLM